MSKAVRETMPKRQRPRSIGARVTDTEQAIVRAAAASAGISVSEYLHRTVLPVARERVLRELNEVGPRTRGERQRRKA